MWKLVIEDDEGKRTSVPLSRDSYAVGRKEGNSIRLTERNVSREHARITRRNDGGEAIFFIEDLGSYNGVYVNGLRIAPVQELAHGDLIQIGDYRVILQNDAVGDAMLVKDDPRSTAPGRTTQRASALLERPNRFVMLAGPTPGAEFPLDKERMTVGRAEDAHISINHNSVSRHHCEVSSLGDGRYEIVDKGSSNGVRVNASDLQRGIIEAGDIVELGDVRFKFVGAGQVFRPGATESQQLAAIGTRAAGAIVGQRRSNVVPYVLFALIVAAGAVAAWALARGRGDHGAAPPVTTTMTPPPPPAPDPLDVLLAEAKKQCESGDCATAHDRINGQIPAGAPQRSAAEFAYVERKWADGLLERADQEPDLDTRRKLYGQVQLAETVGESQRKVAADRLQALDVPDHPVNPSDFPVAARDAGRAAAPTSDEGGGRPTPDQTTPTSPPSAPTTPHARTDMDRVRELLAQDKLKPARDLLSRKVFAHRGSQEEIYSLKKICQQLKDQACVDACKAELKPP